MSLNYLRCSPNYRVFAIKPSQSCVTPRAILFLLVVLRFVVKPRKEESGRLKFSLSCGNARLFGKSEQNENHHFQQSIDLLQPADRPHACQKARGSLEEFRELLGERKK